MQFLKAYGYKYKLSYYREFEQILPPPKLFQCFEWFDIEKTLVSHEGCSPSVSLDGHTMNHFSQWLKIFSSLYIKMRKLKSF